MLRPAHAALTLHSCLKAPQPASKILFVKPLFALAPFGRYCPVFSSCLGLACFVRFPIGLSSKDTGSFSGSSTSQENETYQWSTPRLRVTVLIVPSSLRCSLTLIEPILERCKCVPSNFQPAPSG